jgi:hypothetical protein
MNERILWRNEIYFLIRRQAARIGRDRKLVILRSMRGSSSSI